MVGASPMDRFHLLETVTAFAPLGIRFWDEVLDRQVQDGLVVNARAEGTASPRASAFVTASGIYAFDRLPGTRGDAPTEWPLPASPPAKRAFVVEVVDARERFSRVEFRVRLPLDYQGVFPQDPSPSGLSPKGFGLYSSVVRKAPPWMATVRGELWDADLDQPAAHAAVRVTVPGGQGWDGLADRLGRFQVVFPYPVLPSEFAESSPPSGTGNPLFVGSWDLTLTVAYQPAALEAVVGSRLPPTDETWPYLRSVLGQAPATVELGSASLTLRFGREVVARTPTDPRSRLLIHADGSPP